jgi:hypothetical protein
MQASGNHVGRRSVLAGLYIFHSYVPASSGIFSHLGLAVGIVSRLFARGLLVSVPLEGSEASSVHDLTFYCS